MFLLLLWLGTLTHLTEAELQDISDCPIVYYGKKSTQVSVSSGLDQTILCFVGEGSTDDGGDCVVLSRGGVWTVSVKRTTNTETRPVCTLTASVFADAQATPDFSFELETVGNKNSLKIGSSLQTVALTLSVGSEAVKAVQYQGSPMDEDVSGCRHQGTFLTVGQNKCSGPKIKTCSSDGVLEEQVCGLGEVCRVDQTSNKPSCFLSPRCALVGPVLVDLAGSMGQVPDFCSYTLLKTASFSFVAQFRDRVRTDLAFLHQLHLTFTDPDGRTTAYTIGPGLQVQADGSPVDFGPQTGFPLFERIGASWMLIKVPFNGDVVAAAYDGSSTVSFSAFQDAQQPPMDPFPFEGLCTDVSKVQEHKDQANSPKSCDEVPEQLDDGSIDCEARTERCEELLSDKYVAGCSAFPHFRSSFKDACVTLQCKYPQNYFCSFIGGLSNLCDPQRGSGSQESALCSVNNCGSIRCKDSEFCDPSTSRCRCRAHILKEFSERDTVCESQKASVSIPLCVLREKGLDQGDLHLNQNHETCRGTMDQETDTISFSFDQDVQCGTELQVEEDRIVFQNKVQFDSSSQSRLISRKSSFSLDFSCFYSQPELKTFSLKTKGAEGLQAAIKGSWPYQISVGMFSDLNLKKAIDFSKGIKRNQLIYISMETEGLDGALLLLKADDCYATDRQETGGPKYSLISGGCGNPKDSTIKVFPAKNNRGTVMRIKMFQFRGNKKNVFLKCKMKLCVASSPGCKPDCDSAKSKGNVKGKQRRSVDAGDIDTDDTGYFIIPL